MSEIYKVEKADIDGIIHFCEKAKNSMQDLLKIMMKGKYHPGKVIMQLEDIQEMISNTKFLANCIVKDNNPGENK
jgi:hypothetical protein